MLYIETAEKVRLNKPMKEKTALKLLYLSRADPQAA
jgi:hypothetical protein